MENFNRDVKTTLNQSQLSSYDVSGRNFVAGLFSTKEQAINAINALKKSGFTDQQIGVVVRDRNERGDILDSTNVNDDHSGAAAGAVGGTLLGGLVGLLLGTGAMMIPGVGPVVAGGIFAETLGMTALGAGIGAASGGLLGSLADSGMSEDEARYFESGFRTGSTLVTVKATDRLDEALEIIVRNGGDVGNYYTARHNTHTNTDTSLHASPTLNTTDVYNDVKARTPLKQDTNYIADKNLHQTNVDTDHTMKLREEELKINKHREQAGEVILNKEVIQEQKRVEVPVTREEIVIERHKVNQPVTGNENFIGQSEEVRVPIMEERVDVTKQTFVTEEINVGKKQIHDTEVVNETLRKEKAHLKNVGDVDVHLRDDSRDRKSVV